jgi:dTDP-4-dehydrorhamnose reductase
MRILLTGGSGQVGHELLPQLKELGEVLSPGRDQLNLASEDSILRAVRNFRPQIIVNPGAYTRVDDAETHADIAHSINARAPGLLAELAAEMNAILVHYSTDYVFDGTKQGPWVESDVTHPQNVYGTSKLDGERNILAAGGRFVVFRTSWVYGSHGSNFLLTIRRLAAERTELRIVSDQVGAPTSALQVARATTQLIASFERTSPGDFPSGIYHLTAAGSTSWFGFAEAIVEFLHANMPLKVERILPISSAEFPTPAKRPLNSVLSNAKFAQTFGFQLADWRSGLDEVMRRSFLDKVCG